jgi:hypothetical protein
LTQAKLTPTQWEALRRSAVWGEGPADPAESSYVNYVKALLQSLAPGTPKWPQVARAVLDVAPVELPTVLAASRRRSKLVKVLRAAAERLPTSTVPFPDSIWQGPFASPAEADLAHQCWSRIKVWDSADTRTDRQLLLAAWHKSPPDLETVQHLLGSVLSGTTSDKLEQLPLVFVRAQQPAQTDAERLARVADFAAVVRAISDQSDWLPDALSAGPCYRKLLMPAVQVAESLSAAETKLDETARANLGCLYAAQGFLLWRSYEDLGVAEPLAAALQAYERAVRNAPANAAYHYGRGSVQLKLSTPDLAAVRADAQEAIRLKPAYSGGYALLGSVLIRESRRARGAESLALLRQAEEACSQAVEKSAGDRDLVVYLVNRSNALIALANYATTESLEQREAYLRRAADDAQRASTLDHPYTDYAFRAWGIALEDLGFLCGKHENYARAAEAYQSALARPVADKTAFLDLGRCLYRSVALGGQSPTALENAERALLSAIEHASGNAEPLYWLAHIYHWRSRTDGAAALEQAVQTLERALVVQPRFHLALALRAQLAREQGQWEQVDQYYRQAVQMALEDQNAAWTGYALDWATTVAPGQDWSKRLSGLQPAASLLEPQPRAEAAWFVARVQLAAGDPSTSIRTLEKGLADVDAATDTRALLHYDLAQFKYTLAKSAATPAVLEQVRDHAAQAAQLTGDSQLKALALAQAAIAQAAFVGTAAEPSVRNVAIKQLQEAIALAPLHAQNWYWRVLLVKQWGFLYGESTKWPPEILAEAKKLLKETLGQANVPRESKEQIQRLLREMGG